MNAPTLDSSGPWFSGFAMTERLYLEDLHVGQSWVSEARTLDAEQIKAFAAEYDPQPFHLDEQAAKNSLFKGLAASGSPRPSPCGCWWTLSPWLMASSARSSN
jgi:hypothetical protein